MKKESIISTVIKKTMILAILFCFQVQPSMADTMLASWFSNEETHNKKCADNKWHDLSREFVAASWTYEIGTRLRITRIGGKVVEVSVVDRGPAKRLCKVGRSIDLSKAAFAALAPVEIGVIEVMVEVIK